MTGTTPSRRQVVRAGAWTVPAVAVAAGAPAFAASTQADMSTSTGTLTHTPGSSDVSGSITLVNSGLGATTALVIDVSIAPGGVFTSNTTQHTVSAGWNKSIVGSGSSAVVRFTKIAQVNPGPGGVVTFTVRGATGIAFGTQQTVTALINPPNGPTGSVSQTFTW